MSQTRVNSDDPSLEHNFRGHKSTVTGLSFSSDNKQLASSSHDHSVVIWNLFSNSSRCYNFTGHTDVVTSVDFSPNAQLLASASQDRTVRLWVPTIRGKCMEFRAHSASVRTVSFSPDGTKVNKFYISFKLLLNCGNNTIFQAFHIDAICLNILHKFC